MTKSICGEQFECVNCEDRDTWRCELDRGHKQPHEVWVKHNSVKLRLMK